MVDDATSDIMQAAYDSEEGKQGVMLGIKDKLIMVAGINKIGRRVLFGLYVSLIKKDTSMNLFRK